ncbi:molybdopterin-binding/glycosyltransferase family 2 protein [Sneathiella sp.]|uniref:molybdopterin-binding/glycosyltransferase family 2 protein n=1 Tax=Sneathiella sp. TaxID=1964365 RepID=UPI002FE2D116
MIFKRFPLDEAEGTLLAHAVETAPGKLLRKGHILTKEDIERLKFNGMDAVLAARLEDGDVEENNAAEIISSLLNGPNVTVKPPFTGRCNLTADRRGIVLLNRELLRAINHLDEAITVATMSPYDLVESGQIIATVKIITFSVPEEKIAAIKKLVAEAKTPLLSVQPFARKSIGVISTLLPSTKESVITRSEQVMENRLSRYGNESNHLRRCAHNENDIAASIRELDAEGCDMIFIFGASAITDRGDIIPMGIVNAGGVIDHLGIPVDPGNLLLLGNLRGKPVVGLPSCTRSPKMNGFDWVLERLLADIPITSTDLMDLGEGGLLKEIPGRPQPRQQEMRPISPDNRKSVAVLILAAGQSRRMGRENKLLAKISGKPLLRHIAEEAIKSNARAVYAVTGHERERVQGLLADLKIETVHNPDFASGLSSSLKTGFRALADRYDGILVCLGDMPFITAALLDKLIDAFDVADGRSIVVPTYRGKRGNPVLIATDLKESIQTLTGDIGAKSLIAENEDLVFNVEADKESIFTDIDTPDILEKFRQS